MSALQLRDDLAALRIDRSASREPRRTWLWVGLALLLLVVGGMGVTAWTFRENLVPAVEVQTDSVRVMTQSQARTVLTATGYLESRLQAAVGAKAPGRVARLSVEEGMQVKQGDTLAELEHTELDAMLASRKVAVVMAEAELIEAENQARQAQRDYAREQNLFQKGAGTEAALELSETASKAADARVQSKRAAVDVAKAQVVEAQEAISNMFVYAPFAGTVIQKDAEVGETIMPGGMGLASGRGSVATLADLSQLEVDTDVKEDYLNHLRKGQPAEVVVDAVTNRRYRGQLREIIPMGDRTRGIVKVKVSVLDADERLFPELSATVHFLPEADQESAGGSKKAVFAPASAVVAEGDQSFVWTIDEDRAYRVPVTTLGEPRDGLIQIERGLSGGETVIVSPPALENGTRVQVAE